MNKKITSKRKKKVTKTVTTLILTFVLLWLPVHFLTTWYRLDEHFPEGDVMFLIKLIAHTMSYSISTINPIIYSRCFLQNKNNESTNCQNTNTNNKRSFRVCLTRETANKEIQMVNLI